MAYMKDLAVRIDEFSRDFDPYDYDDNYDEPGGAIVDIESMMESDPTELAATLRNMAKDAADDEERDLALGLADEVDTLAKAQASYTPAAKATTIDKLKMTHGEKWQKLELAKAGIGLDALVHDCDPEVVATCAQNPTIASRLRTSQSIAKASLAGANVPIITDMARTSVLYPDADSASEAARGMCVARIGDALEDDGTMRVLVAQGEGQGTRLLAMRLSVDPAKTAYVDIADPLTGHKLPATVVSPALDANMCTTMRPSPSSAPQKIAVSDLFESLAKAQQICLDCKAQEKVDLMRERDAEPQASDERAPIYDPELEQMLAAMPDDEFSSYGP